MKKFITYIKNIWFKKKNRAQKRKLFMQDAPIKSKKSWFKKRKNLHFQTSLDSHNNKKILFYSYLSIGLFIVVWIISLWFSSKFTVQNIEIVRKDNISNINLTYNAVNSFRGKSIFLVDKPKMIQRIHNYQNNIDTITIESILPDTLMIHIGSAQQLFYSTIENKDYIITSNGSLVPEKPSSQLQKLDIIFRDVKLGIIDYKKILKAKHIQTIAYIIEQLEKNIIWLEIQSLSYLPLERELHITTNNDNTLLFDIWEQFDQQIEKVAIFHKEQSSLTQPWITYMDLRIPEKIFFCPDEIKKVCIENLREIYSK